MMIGVERGEERRSGCSFLALGPTKPPPRMRRRRPRRRANAGPPDEGARAAAAAAAAAAPGGALIKHDDVEHHWAAGARRVAADHCPPLLLPLHFLPHRRSALPLPENTRNDTMTPPKTRRAARRRRAVARAPRGPRRDAARPRAAAAAPRLFRPVERWFGGWGGGGGCVECRVFWGSVHTRTAAPQRTHAPPVTHPPQCTHTKLGNSNKDGRITLIESWRALRHLKPGRLFEPLNTVFCFWLALALHLPVFWW